MGLDLDDTGEPEVLESFSLILAKKSFVANDGTTPSDVEEILNFRGIGHKICNLIMESVLTKTAKPETKIPTDTAKWFLGTRAPNEQSGQQKFPYLLFPRPITRKRVVIVLSPPPGAESSIDMQQQQQQQQQNQSKLRRLNI